MNKGAINKLLLIGVIVGTGLLSSAPAFADWDHHGGGHGGGHGWGHHDHGGISLSFGYGYNPYYGGYYGYPGYYSRPVYYGYPAYYAPPPTVVYEAPPQVVYAPAPVMHANQTSETYIDENGQTCREYQSTGRVAGHAQQTYGTACLQQDGSWRIVQ